MQENLPYLPITEPQTTPGSETRTPLPPMPNGEFPGVPSAPAEVTSTASEQGPGRLARVAAGIRGALDRAKVIAGGFQANLYTENPNRHRFGLAAVAGYVGTFAARGVLSYHGVHTTPSGPSGAPHIVTMADVMPLSTGSGDHAQSSVVTDAVQAHGGGRGGHNTILADPPEQASPTPNGNGDQLPIDGVPGDTFDRGRAHRQLEEDVVGGLLGAGAAAGIGLRIHRAAHRRRQRRAAEHAAEAAATKAYEDEIEPRIADTNWTADDIVDTSRASTRLSRGDLAAIIPGYQDPGPFAHYDSTLRERPQDTDAPIDVVEETLRARGLKRRRFRGGWA